MTCEGAFGSFQPTLFAISTLDGSIKWATYVGPCYSPPVLAGDRIYVVSHDGNLIASDAADGHQIFSLTLTTSSTVSKEITYVPDYPMILVTDDGGFVYGIADLGNSAAEAWPSNWGSFRTTPRYVPGTETFYVGGGYNSTTVSRVDFTNGHEEASYLVAGWY